MTTSPACPAFTTYAPAPWQAALIGITRTLRETWVGRRLALWLRKPVLLALKDQPVLIVVGEVMGWRLAAQMLHVPLGVLGFVAACAAALGFLRWQKPLTPEAESQPGSWPQSAWLAPGLAVTFSLMALIYAPRPHTGLTQLPPAWRFPAELITQPVPLKPDEVEWLTRDGAESAERLRFEWRGLTGSLILITSQTWRAHHRPERCFAVFGLTLEN